MVFWEHRFEKLVKLVNGWFFGQHRFEKLEKLEKFFDVVLKWFLKVHKVAKGEFERN
jgi:hypothetical protein